MSKKVWNWFKIQHIFKGKSARKKSLFLVPTLSLEKIKIVIGRKKSDSLSSLRSEFLIHVNQLLFFKDNLVVVIRQNTPISKNHGDLLTWHHLEIMQKWCFFRFTRPKRWCRNSGCSTKIASIVTTVTPFWILPKPASWGKLRRCTAKVIKVITFRLIIINQLNHFRMLQSTQRTVWIWFRRFRQCRYSNSFRLWSQTRISFYSILLIRYLINQLTQKWACY